MHVDAEQMTEIRQRIEGHPPQEFSDQKDPCKIGYATSHNVVQQHSSSLRDLGHMKNNVYCMLSQKIDLFAICAIVF